MKKVRTAFGIFVSLAFLLCMVLCFPVSAGQSSLTTSPTSGRIYYLRNANSHRYLDTLNGSSAISGRNLVQREFTGNTTQQFRIISEGNGYYSFRPVDNESLRVDVNNASDSNGAILKLYVENYGYGAQEFKFISAGNNRFAIMPRLSTTKVIEVSNSSRSDNAQVQLWTRNANNLTMHWYLEEATAPGIETNAEYYIKNVFTGRYLDVQGGAREENGNNVGNYGYNGNSNQKWRVLRNSDGTYSLRASYNNNFALDVQGTNLDIWWYGSYPDDQHFSLTRDNTFSYGGTYTICNKSRKQYVIASGNDVSLGSGSGTNALWSFEKASRGDADIYTNEYVKWALDNFPVYTTTGAANTFLDAVNTAGYTGYHFKNFARDTAFSYMKMDDIFVHAGHGYAGGISFTTDGGYNFSSISANNVYDLPNNSLNNLRLFITTGCSSGAANGEGRRVVRAIYDKGANFSLGFINTTMYPGTTAWLNGFFSSSKNGNTVLKCIQDANSRAQSGLFAPGSYYYFGDTYQKLR